MVSLGIKERFVQFHRRDDAPAENACPIQLSNIGPGYAGLFGVLRKHGRAVLRTVVRPLPVELRWIVRDRKLNLKQLRKTHLSWVEADAHCLGMTSPARADGIVVGSAGVAAGIARNGPGNADNMPKNTLNAPEAATSEHGGVGSDDAGLRL